MSLVNLVYDGTYKSYKAWVFLKDWVVLFVATMVIMSGTFLLISFVTWDMVYWEYFKESVWSYTRWAGIVSFLLGWYFFSDSYNNTLIILGVKKAGE